MHEYGTTSEELAEIGGATRKWAQRNPSALNREPLTIDEVLDSPWLVYPFHLRDCCLVTDVGGAFRIAAEHLDRCFLGAATIVRSPYADGSGSDGRTIFRSIAQALLPAVRRSDGRFRRSPLQMRITTVPTTHARRYHPFTP